MKRLRFEGISWNGHYSADVSDVPDEDQFSVWVEEKGFTQFIQLLKEWSVHGGHGGDEYGNCTLYFRCPLFGMVWWYPTGHYQTEIELTDPGRDKWIDRVYYGGCDKHEADDDSGNH